MRSILSKLRRKTIKWSLGLLSFYLTRRLRKAHAHRPLDIALIDAIAHVCIVKPRFVHFSQKDNKQYQKTLSRVAYWHGTGKLQYKDGKVLDVFEEMLSHGGLRPAKDIFDPKMGEMMSISLARQRMYARVYADMHAYNGVRKHDRYGTPIFWAYYFIMASIIQVLREFKVLNPTLYRDQMRQGHDKTSNQWSVKVKTNPDRSVGVFFNKGSDILGNYPILIGIRDGAYKQLETSEGIQLYESRIGSTIPVSNFTHLEVPTDKIEEITGLLDKHHLKIPVYPFEQCEQFFSSRRFSELVSKLN
jgi:hypothetical protein